ncbi:MAG: tRNA(Ile)-lysidine synthase [Anaerolineaceae bacterium]|nr:MAG: tRNA(Ile)-lysidine synthase [Anaerolineaceae bacterium]
MLESILRDQCQLDPTRPVLAGISGGPDSLCLLDVLRAAGYPVIVAHFNHKLRPEADLESASVSGRARTLGLPFVTDSADVRAYAGANSLSLEEAARTLRYRFLFAAARREGAQAVAVGHTADDQVETVLMHFLRGAGLAGLKGMETLTLLPVFDPEIPIIRPLLTLWRADTEDWCRAHGLEPHFDATNADQTYFRNRLRHTLIPELEKYNPRFKESLLRTASALQGDFAVLQDVLDKAWTEAVSGTGAGWVAFDASKLAQLSTGLRRNLIRRAGEMLRPDSRDFGFDALERAAGFVEKPGGKQVDFVNGLYLFAESGKIYLAEYEADLPSAQFPQVSVQFPVNSKQCDLGNGWALTIEHQPLDTVHCPLYTDNWSAWLDADLTGDRLTVRPRRAGDRFTPLGMESGSVKLSDFFVNVKLPRRARAGWPLICAGEEIAWAPGFRIAHRFRVTEKTKRVLHLEIKRLP